MVSENLEQIRSASNLTSTMPMAKDLRSMGYKSATMAGAIAIAADPPIPARNLMMIRPVMFCAKPHPIRKETKNQDERVTTMYLPYISLSGLMNARLKCSMETPYLKGARNSGPNAQPRRYIVIIREPIDCDDS